MGRWELIDGRHPADDPATFPTVTVSSEAQLRSELSKLIDHPPGIVALVGPTGEALQIGIGGPFVGIRWRPDPRAKEMREVISDRQHTDRRVDYASEGDSIAFWPEHLIPVEQAIELVISFYCRGRLPTNSTWKEWDGELKQWVVKRLAG